MPLQMPRPMKRPGSSFHQLVQRIPADVAAKVRGLKLAIPVGDEVANVVISEKAKDVRTSLRTRDPAEAKARQLVAVSYLDAVWRSVREGPQRLTHKQTIALAGEVYAILTTALEDDPGLPERWLWAEAGNLKAEFGDFGRAPLMILSEEERQLRSIEERVGGFADAVLAKRGLVVDAESRARLNLQVLGALRQANLLLVKRAEGDYSPDREAGRFPAFPEATATTKAVSLIELFEPPLVSRRLQLLRGWSHDEANSPFFA